MDDRFKSRVWLKAEKHYAPPGKILLSDDGRLWREDYPQGLVYVGENCIYEQCTGLKDLCGKLVFDGDVIENKKYGGRAVIRWGIPGESYCGWCVEWVPEDVNKGHMKHDLLYYSNFANCEIIGNIHDNPELLEVAE